MSTDPDLMRLKQIRHLVVVMMENRSFDQMLGYLKRDGMPELDGLDGTESNPGDDGQPVPVFEWGLDQTVFHPPQDHTGKILDPCHSKQCVAEQLSDGNRGFVKNFVATRVDTQGNPVTIPAEYHKLPMGYYSSRHLPTYDFLARNYCVCDAWHASVPGDTWPNRMFSLAGREGPHVLPGLIDRIEERFKLHRLDELFQHQLSAIENAPIYDVPAFTRQLEDGQWRWYSHDPATLRAADGRYREWSELDRNNFAFFDRQRMSLLTRLLEEPIVAPDSFLDDCASGRLRDVSWIDPNFIDLKVLDPASNDDHPPTDIRAGQAFILEVYEALRNSPEWEETVLIVVYDEHGGFFDHVVPPPLGFDDGSGYQTYGVRVPAIIVGPRVKKEVCKQPFDHTSLIKTILLRFAANPDQAIAAMGTRVERAQHVGSALQDDPRTDIDDHSAVQARIAAWREEALASRRGDRELGASPAPDGAGRPVVLHDFQEDFVKFSLAMRHAGLPAGEP
jgi:phospholipase C